MELSQRRRRLLGRLRGGKARAREGLVLVEGVRAVGEALDAEAEVRFVLSSPRLNAVAGGTALAARLKGLEPHLLDDPQMAEVSDTGSHQGVLIVVAEPVIAPDGLGARLLVLDGVQDPGNLGTLVRAAAAFAMDGVVALDGTVDPWGTKSVRASAGMVFRLPVIRRTVAAFLTDVDVSGRPIVVADAGGRDVRGAEVGPTFALVLGNEGAGVRDTLRAHSTHTVSVSMPGGAESLNVGMAGAILLHELTREDRV